MKTDRLFKTAFNDLLQRVRSRAPQAPLGPETRLAEQLSVSRTTIRKILKELSTRGHHRCRPGRLCDTASATPG